MCEHRASDRTRGDLPAGEQVTGAAGELPVENRIDISESDSGCGQCLPVPVLCQEGRRIEDSGCMHHGLLEWLMLEGVQGVVVNENRYRSLGRQVVCGILNRLPHGLFIPGEQRVGLAG